MQQKEELDSMINLGGNWRAFPINNSKPLIEDFKHGKFVKEQYSAMNVKAQSHKNEMMHGSMCGLYDYDEIKEPE